MSRPLITVKTLLAQARAHGTIELPEHALITPAAADWLHACRLPVQRVPAPDPLIAAGPLVYIVGDARSPAAQTLWPTLERRHSPVQFLPCHGHLAGLLAALQEMCAALAECTRRRGVVLVCDGAITSCVLNRHAHVRAAIATQPSAMFHLLHNLGINVLILETEHLALRQMQAMIESFLTARTSVDPAIAAALTGHQPAPDAASPPAACGPGA